ncbi:hypothetical protein AC578_96 [Pseudocercospora eumusae]|uniref:Uncharacterized protein n=1 Tax=Pseudocercospora eumusae TaxID=321146 RepID=A0A139HNX8_9PEZI|nr:hypothetical protein AC578_96 [Pseudocercospora eumusae]
MDKMQDSGGLLSRKDSIEPSALANDPRIAETALPESDEEASSEDEQSQIANDPASMRSHARMVEYFRLKAPSMEETERPRPNLQNLPQEMRDEIYSYLLDADTVKYTPDYKSFSHSSEYSEYGGTAHSYRFHTGIFGVNKEVAANSHKYFLSQNSIIKFNFVCPGMPRLLHVGDVPILADHSFDYFDHYSFKISLSSLKGLPEILTWDSGDMHEVPTLERNGDWDDEALAELAESKEEDFHGSVLLLQQDLPKLWEMLRLIFLFSAPPTATLAFEAGNAMVVEKIAGESSDIAMAVSRHEENIPRSFLEQRTADFLRGLSTVTGAGYRLTLHGFDPRDTAQVQLDMAPEMIWLRAYGWDRFELLRTMKRRTDQLAMDGNLDAGELRYEFLQKLTDPEQHWSSETQDAQVVNASILVEHLHVDVKLSRVWLMLRRELIYDALALFDDIYDTTAIGDFNDTFEDHRDHIGAITDFMMCADDRSYEVHRAAHEALNRLQSLPEDEHISHDIDLLSTKLGLSPPPGTPSTLIALARHVTWQAVFHSLSVFALPFRPFHSTAYDLDQTRPEGLKGWQDVKHLSQLTLKDKSAIWWRQQTLRS